VRKRAAFPGLSGLFFPSSLLELLLWGMAGIMDQRNHGVYPPLNVLKPVTQNLWIVDGPVIWFGVTWPKMPFQPE
jgi:hypothetical protein